MFWMGSVCTNKLSQAGTAVKDPECYPKVGGLSRVVTVACRFQSTVVIIVHVLVSPCAEIVHCSKSEKVCQLQSYYAQSQPAKLGSRALSGTIVFNVVVLPNLVRCTVSFWYLPTAGFQVAVVISDHANTWPRFCWLTTFGPNRTEESWSASHLRYSFAAPNHFQDILHSYSSPSLQEKPVVQRRLGSIV